MSFPCGNLILAALPIWEVPQKALYDRWNGFMTILGKSEVQAGSN